MVNKIYRVDVCRGIIFEILMSQDVKPNIEMPNILLIANPRSFNE